MKPSFTFNFSPLTLLSLVSISLPCIADPFYADSATTPQTEQAEKKEKTTACNPTQQVRKFALDTEFKQLTLVGIIEREQQFTALFIDEKNHLITLKTNDYLISSDIQISEITLKQVNYINWKNTAHCENPTITQLTL